jgi:hypothetical protein
VEVDGIVEALAVAIAVAKANAFRLIHWIFEFNPSLLALVTLFVTALITPSQ